MENLRALPLTCVRVRLSTAGADVCDIMESLSIPELFLQEKSLSSISASGKIFHRHKKSKSQRLFGRNRHIRSLIINQRLDNTV